MSQQAQVHTARPKVATGAHEATRIQVGVANDAYERAADRAAEEVMMGLAWSLFALSITPRVQRTCACGGKAGAGCECEECKEKKILQRSARGAAAMESAPPVVHEVLQTPGRPLDRSSLDFFELRFGRDFGGVRVHLRCEGGGICTQRKCECICGRAAHCVLGRKVFTLISKK